MSTYKDLKSYQNAVIIHDVTVEFIKRYIPANSRTRDQMEQAARSGKQNIAEATSSSKQKPKSEPMLLGVASPVRGREGSQRASASNGASASLKELLEDYQDYLRQHGLVQWDKNDSRSLRVRGLYRSDKSYRSDKLYAPYKSYTSDKTYMSDMSNRSYTTYKSYQTYLSNAEDACNAMICLINQTTYLLDNQIRAVDPVRSRSPRGGRSRAFGGAASNGIERQLEKKGLPRESETQRIRRVIAVQRRREQEVDAIVAEVLKDV